MNNKNNQIKFGSVISYLTIGLNIALGLVYTPWILRSVGSSDYGLYTLASSLIALFLLDFGMSSAVTRFVARYRAVGDQESVNSFVGFSTKFYLAICFIVACILTFVYFNLNSIYGNLTVEELDSFRIIFILTAIFVVICFPVNICNGILNAYEEYVSLKLADVINKLGTVIVTIIALCLHGGIATLVFINGFFNLLTFLVKILLVKARTPVKIKFKNNNQIEARSIISFTGWTTVQTLAKQMVFNLIPSVLAMVANTFAITLFGFANTIEGYVSTITQAINGLFLPSISRIVVDDDDAKKTLPLMIKVGRINQSVVSLLLIGLAVLGQEFVHLWVGDEYGSLYYCILFLTMPYFISASQQIANSSIIALNKVRYSALIQLLTGIVNLLSSYYVAGKFGVTGVCMVIGIISTVRIILLNIVYVRQLKIDIWTFFKKCQIQMLPGVLLSAVIGAIAVMFIPSMDGLRGWMFFAVKTVVMVLVYFICMWLFTWNDYEKEIIKSFIPKRRGGKENG